MDWIGSYNDPIYGGDIHVCVSLVNGIYFGQATFSKIGYMRGIIQNNNSWSGEFWSAGLEVKKGSFDLLLAKDGNDVSFTGTFHELPDINYSIHSKQHTATEPGETDCFKADDHLLALEPPAYSMGGIWQAYATQYNIYSNETFQLTCSYEVLGEFGYVGAAYHSSSYLNGQVSSGNYYEGPLNVGIELLVAKNENNYYSSYWNLSRVSDLNYTQQVHIEGFTGIDVYTLVNRTATFDQANKFVCLLLPSLTAQNNCYDAAVPADTDSTNTDCNDNYTSSTVFIVTLVSSFVGGVIVCSILNYFMHRSTVTSNKNTAKRTAFLMGNNENSSA